jgi:crossover junction endodeoxyribonuclease RuvC
MGYAVVREDRSTLTLVTAGALQTSSELPLERRLSALYDGLIGLYDAHGPTEVAVEELFFNRNVRSALSVGQARGVALLAAAHRELTVHGYTPLQVKEAVTGYGRARKEQIQEMVRVLLNLPAVLRPDDAADAAAIAICHLNSAATRAAMADAVSSTAGATLKNALHQGDGHVEDDPRPYQPRWRTAR